MPTRHFLDPKRPLLDSLTPALLKHGLHLAETLVIVPTAHSGRRLRRALAHSAGLPILAPRVATPDSAFRSGSASPAASNIAWYAAWKEVLKSTSDTELNSLFPHIRELSRDPSWALANARGFTRLKNEIAEIDQDFEGVARIAIDDQERWTCLHQLDQQVTALLRKWGLRCPAEMKRLNAVHWSPPEGIKRLVLACVPDAVPLSIRAWRNADGQIPIDVFIHADEALCDHFDDWGQIRSEQWSDLKINLPGEEQAIEVAASTREMALRVTHSCSAHDNNQVTLGLVDSSCGPAIEEAFAESGWTLFNPEGRRITRTGLWVFLQQLRLLLRKDADFNPVPILIKSPEARYLLKSLKSAIRCAKDIDRLAVESLPSKLTEAVRAARAERKKPLEASLPKALEELQDLCDSAQSGKMADWFSRLNDRLGGAPGFTDAIAQALADATDALRHLESIPDLEMSRSESFDLVLSQVESLQIDADSEGSVLDALGWLELAYESAPHLRLAGFHEGSVPNKPDEDGFLTESLRTRLGLRGRLQREARDAYLFSSLVQSRADHGSVKAFISLTDSAGNSSKASRLLLRCHSNKLSKRVLHCFPEELEDSKRIPSYDRADWILKSPAAPMIYKPDQEWTVSPSLLADYLRCPFRFYLKRQLEFDRKDFDKRELDAMDFGNLVHKVLEEFGKDPTQRDMQKADKIADALEAKLKEVSTERFGTKLNLALSIQLESAKRRLREFAKHQAAARAEGWKIIEVELAIGPDSEKGEIAWKFHGRDVRMRIDRVDQHDDGRIRLIDYKSGKAKSPADKHLDRCPIDEDERFIFGELIPSERRNTRPKRWKELQLPLYAEYAHQRWKKFPEVAYAQLPPVASESGFDSWEDYDEDLHHKALTWATTAIDKINEGFFEPRPQKAPDWDEFNSLAPDSLQEAFKIS